MSRATTLAPDRSPRRRPRRVTTAVVAMAATSLLAAAGTPDPAGKVVAAAPDPGPVEERPASSRVAVQSPPDVIAAATRAAMQAPDPDEAANGGVPPAPRTVWDDLADCESGLWVDGVPQRSTARWDYGLTESGLFEGGLQFHPPTWDSFRDPGMPDHAGAATREQQITVGERVLDAQGWRAWPVCSRKLGLR